MILLDAYHSSLSRSSFRFVCHPSLQTLCLFFWLLWRLHVLHSLLRSPSWRTVIIWHHYLYWRDSSSARSKFWLSKLSGLEDNHVCYSPVHLFCSLWISSCSAFSVVACSCCMKRIELSKLRLCTAASIAIVDTSLSFLWHTVTAIISAPVYSFNW